MLKEHSSVAATVTLIMEGQSRGEFIQEDPVKLEITYYTLIQGLAINKIRWEDCPLPSANIDMSIFR